MYTIITDGAYSSMRNQGGVGIIILNEDGDEVLEYSKPFINTTNNQMEILELNFMEDSIFPIQSVMKIL